MIDRHCRSLWTHTSNKTDPLVVFGELKAQMPMTDDRRTGNYYDCVVVTGPGSIPDATRFSE
jgi:hypothetical protein